MRRPAAAAAWILALLLAQAASPAWPQTVSGEVFEDRDADGVRDAGEPAVAGISVGVYGRGGDPNVPVDLSTSTASDGSWMVAPGDGCYLIDLPEPAGWRLVPPRFERKEPSSPAYSFPVGLSRLGALAQLPGGLRAGASVRYASMGDSIAWNFNVCSYPESFWYSKQVRDRIACAGGGAAVGLDEAAVKGEHTDDLLVDDSADLNNVFRIVEVQPDLITLSMLGNDLLDVDVSGTPTQAQVNLAVAEILDSRRNLQEALSVMVSEIPGADILLNTLYDNLAYACPGTPTSSFHREWIPIVGQILRELAWGQARRVGVIEAAADFGQEGLAGSCSGFGGMICRDLFGFDRIHPNNSGYTLMREKAWEGMGGVLLGPSDALGRSSFSGADLGMLRLVRRIAPTSWQTAGGAAVSSPAAAFDLQDGGASASITLGAGAEEFRLTGFPDWYDEIEVVKVIAGVRYATTGSVNDDAYRMEASVDGRFAPDPNEDYSPLSWNFYTPLVGGGGPSQPPGNEDYPGNVLLALPDVASPRVVTATLTKNPVLPPGSDNYEWPPVTRAELATSAIRVVAAPVAGTPGNDGYTVELDGAWLDLYGWEKPRPPQVTGLEASLRSDGILDLAFDEIAGAQRYNLYTGSLDALLSTGEYGHGTAAPAGPWCDRATLAAGPGRRAMELPAGSVPSGSVYILVTAHVDDVESPSGTDSSSAEIDRSQSICD